MEPPHFLGQRASIRSGHTRYLAEKSNDPTQVTYVRNSRTLTVLRKQIFIQAAGANIIVVPVPLRAYTAICKGSKKLFERKQIWPSGMSGYTRDLITKETTPLRVLLRVVPAWLMRKKTGQVLPCPVKSFSAPAGIPGP